MDNEKLQVFFVEKNDPLGAELDLVLEKWYWWMVDIETNMATIEPVGPFESEAEAKKHAIEEIGE